MRFFGCFAVIFCCCCCYVFLFFYFVFFFVVAVVVFFLFFFCVCCVKGLGVQGYPRAFNGVETRAPEPRCNELHPGIGVVLSIGV